MKVHTRLIAAEKLEESILSLEIIPPFKGEDIRQLFKTMDQLIRLRPEFINVTNHPAEYRLFEDPSIGTTKRVVYKRPGTLSICAAIAYRYKIETVAHMICVGEDENKTEEKLIELNYLNIKNVLALQGDIRENFAFTGRVRYASDLVSQIDNINKGIYLEKDLANTSPMDFSIGVAGYPEKHHRAKTMDEDIARLKEKIDKGANYIITQMFFDNTHFFRFVERCRAAGITVPIAAGLKPLTSKKHLEVLPKLFHVDIPKPLRQAVESATTKEELRAIGIDWCIQQSLELKAMKVACLHFYTMNKPKIIQEIVNAVFHRQNKPSPPLI